MSRLFQRLCCIPSTDVLTAEDHSVFVSGQEGLGSNKTRGSHNIRNGTMDPKLSSKPVAPQGGTSSANIRSYEGIEHSKPVIKYVQSNIGLTQQSVEATLQDALQSNISENTRIVPIGQDNVNSRNTGDIDSKLLSDRPTIQVTKQAEFQSLPLSNSQAVEKGIGATLQDAHHFSIGGNARIVNIGQQVNNRGGTYGLDTLEKFVSFSALHDSSAQDPKRCCHPDTRKSVIRQICNWVDDPTRPERILWLHGPAGVGKSAIAQTISYLYGRDRKPFTSNPGLAIGIIGTFRKRSSLENYPDLPRKTVEIQFDQLIAGPSLTISGDESPPTPIRVIIIDGLDECADTNLQERILKIIGNAVADSRFPLRFIISSGPEADIQDFFDQFQSPTLRIDLAKVGDAFRDIETYFISEFTRIAIEQELDPKAWPDEGIIDTLVSKSSGQFVYAATVMKCVGDKYESAVAQLNVILGLKPSIGTSPFSELDTLYTEILQRQRDQKVLKEFLPILVARSMLVGIEDGNLDDAILLGLDEKQLHRKLRGIRSLLKFEPFIGVHHKSFLDFLDDSSRSGEYHVSKHFANRRYLQLITYSLVKAASRMIDQPDVHENGHFKPRFSAVTKRFPFPIVLSLNDLEEILRPLHIIQEKMLQLPNMSVPWKPRGCDECWTFYMVDDLLLQLACFPRTMQLQGPKYVGIRPLTAMEKKQKIPQLDLDDCLSLLLVNLRGVKSQLSLNADTIGLVRALVHFDPTETAMKVRLINDAQNLIELIFCLNKNQCFNSWFGAAAHNATRLALAVYGRVPLLPRSLFLNNADLDYVKFTYQGKAVRLLTNTSDVQHECFDVFIRGNLSYGTMGPLLGLCSFQSSMKRVLPSLEHDTLHKWRQSSNPSVSKIQQTVFDIANTIQYVHSLGIILHPDLEEVHYLDNAIVESLCFRLSCLSDRQLKYNGYTPDFTLETNIYSFGLLFYNILFNFPDEITIEIRPEEPEIPDNVWELIKRCCAEDPKERPTIDQVVHEMESWISLG